MPNPMDSDWDINYEDLIKEDQMMIDEKNNEIHTDDENNIEEGEINIEKDKINIEEGEINIEEDKINIEEDIRMNDEDEKIETLTGFERDKAIDIRKLSKLKYYYETKQEFEKQYCKIITPHSIMSKGCVDDVQTWTFYPMQAARDIFADIFHLADVGDKKKPEPFFKRWLTDIEKLCYKGIVFRPEPLSPATTHFNTWTGFEIAEPMPTNDTRNYFAEYYTYIENLFASKAVAQFILARWAYRIQKPGLRTKVCLIVCGQEGQGKNSMFDVMYKIWGKWGIQLDTTEKLYDTHSVIEKERLFVLVNEAVGTANFENSERLKTRITDTTVHINPKNIQSYSLDNLCDYEMTTNNYNVVKITDDSHRRFLQVETTPFYKGNSQFWMDYHKNVVGNPNAIKQIFDGLRAFDVDAIVRDANFQGCKPTTSIERDIKCCNRDNTLLFVDEEVHKNEYDRKEVVKFSNDELFVKWAEWTMKNNVKNTFDKRQFGFHMGNLIRTRMNAQGVLCVDKNLKKSMNTFYVERCRAFFEKLNA
jgi:Family of unknown function (DUF5906)